MEATMRAMVLERAGGPLREERRPIPVPGPEELLLRVHTCAVCRTDLHVVDGDLPASRLPLVPGHEIIASVVGMGERVLGFTPGTRVGVPWLGGCCGTCRFCLSGRENLCDRALFTGYQRDGGYAEYTVADYRFCFRIPEAYSDVQAAPLMCAGLIGYRSLRMAGEGRRLGMYGFGAAAHMLVQVALHQGRRVFAFTKPGDTGAQQFALKMGAEWVGGSDTLPPEPLDAAILFAPVGELVPQALRAVDKGGVVVCGGIHMSDIPSFPYATLWEERVLRSVANLTRQDALDFLALVPRVAIRSEVEVFPLAAANEALAAVREGRIRGAAVLDVRAKG